jgi:hypothetical protein
MLVIAKKIKHNILAKKMFKTEDNVPGGKAKDLTFDTFFPAKFSKRYRNCQKLGTAEKKAATSTPAENWPFKEPEQC